MEFAELFNFLVSYYPRSQAVRVNTLCSNGEWSVGDFMGDLRGLEDWNSTGYSVMAVEFNETDSDWNIKGDMYLDLYITKDAGVKHG